MKRAYFAYGSNMDPVQMEQRAPGARARGAALLRDYRLTFTFDSIRWAGGVGHVEPAPGENVWGVLWDLTEDDEAALDIYESVAENVYTKADLRVEFEGEPVQALVYLAVATGVREPSKRYLRALIRGARAHQVPLEYVTGLEGLLEGSLGA